MLATENEKTTEYRVGPSPVVAAHRCPKVAVVQGSGPDLSGELLSLRRVRLRAAALMLFAGFGLFLIWRILFESRVHGMANRIMEVLHIAMVVILGAATVVLRWPCPYSSRVL